MTTVIHGPAYPLQQEVMVLPAPGMTSVPLISTAPAPALPAPTTHPYPDLVPVHVVLPVNPKG